MGSVPVRVCDSDTLVDTLDGALNSVEECSGRAVAAAVGIKLTSSTLDTFNSIPESSFWANTLTQSIIPDSSLIAGLVRNALNAVVVRSSGASVGGGCTAVGGVPGKT